MRSEVRELIAGLPWAFLLLLAPLDRGAQHRLLLRFRFRLSLQSRNAEGTFTGGY